ncbi:hypothetical protein J5224_24905, partial [Candidatus Symbiopectobacterium sp. NZEC135]|nr:hypothetical protein [Candidatus Symbiopectobacterium sp. NZEC135]
MTLTQTHPLLTLPFSSATDFAAHSERFAGALLESNDPALKQALCGRLVACLALGKLLTECALSQESEPLITGLLSELVWCFSAELKTPRRARTETRYH